MNRKSLVSIIAAVSAVSLFAQAPEGERSAVVGIATATEQECVTERRYIGRIVAEEQVSLFAEVSGRINEVCFKEGDMVAKDAVLYRIGDTSYRAAVASAKAQIAQAKSSLANTEKNFKRTKALYEKKVASDEDLDNATQAYESSQAALAAGEAALMKAQHDLDCASVTTPIAGKVGATAFTKGNFVTLSSGPLATVVSTDPVRLRFAISNRDIIELFGGLDNLKDDMIVEIELADGKRLATEGKFLFTDNLANSDTDSISLYVQFPNADGRLVPGSAVTAYARRKTVMTMVAIPLTAVIRNTKGSTVYVVEKDEKGVQRAQPRDVETGSTSENMIFVKTGLKAGDVVVSKGTHKVFPGIKVETRE